MTVEPAGKAAECNAARKDVGGSIFAKRFAMIRTALAGTATANAAGPPPTALGPAQIQDAYKLPATGRGQTVGIVDAFGDSNAETDLGVFRRSSVCRLAPPRMAVSRRLTRPVARAIRGTIRGGRWRPRWTWTRSPRPARLATSCSSRPTTTVWAIWASA
jgi:hypothetical protein